MKQYEVNSDVVEQDIDRAIKLAGGLTTTGIPETITSKIPATPAYDLREVVMGVKANIGFDKLQSMRDASPTEALLDRFRSRKTSYCSLSSAFWGTGAEPGADRVQLAAFEKDHPQYRDLKRQAYEDDVNGLAPRNAEP